MFKKSYLLVCLFFNFSVSATQGMSEEEKFDNCMFTIRCIVDHYPHELMPLKKYIISPCSDYSEEQKKYFSTILKGIRILVRRQRETEIRTYSEKHFLLLIQDDFVNKVPISYQRLDLHFSSLPH